MLLLQTLASVCQAILGSPVVIAEPSIALSATSNKVDVLCPGGSDGFISLTPGGGWGGYTFNWSGAGGPFTTQNITNLVPGIYTPTISDQGGCSVTLNPITVSAPQQSPTLILK
ncbi:MAG: SprB repeat-containing protein [Saprospiraceae bacterium]